MAQVYLNLVPNSDGEYIYYAGEVIKALFVTLIGQAKVEFYEILKKKRTHYTEKYLDRETRFFRHEDAVKMQPGTYNYQFAFELPQLLPRSHTYKLTYEIQGNLDIPWKFMKTSRKQFELRRFDNLNLYPILYLPRMKHVDKEFFKFSFKCGAEGIFRLTAFLPCSGYVPGQIIRVKLRYENLSSVQINKTEVELKETEVERYEEENLTNRRSITLVKKDVEGVNERDMKEVDCELVIPFNTQQSDFLYSRALTVRHSIKITAIPEGLHIKPTFIIPIVIGSDPLVNIPNGQHTIVGIDSAVMRIHLAKNKF